MPCILGRLCQRRSSTSHANNLPSQGAIRRVRFDPVIQYRVMSSKSQGIDMENVWDTLSNPQSRPSRRWHRDSPPSRRPDCDSSRNSSPNPHALNQGSPKHNPHLFIRGPNDPPTPWVREKPPLQESPFQSPTATYQWTPTMHMPQQNQYTTPNLGTPGIFVPQAPPFQPPSLWATPSPTAQMNPIQAQASTPWTPQVVVASTPQINGTPLVAYFCTAGVTQPQTNPPPNFWIPPTPMSQIIPQTSPSPTAHQLQLGIPVGIPAPPESPAWERNHVEHPVVPQAGTTSSHATPTTWRNQPHCPSTPQVTPTSQNMFSNHSVRPCERIRVNDSVNNLRGDQADTLLTSGYLNWDIRLFPAMSRFYPARPYVPDLDSPALSNEILIALIEFEDPRLRVFSALWGAIRVQSGRPSVDNAINSILIKDVMEAIYQYFLEPITTEDQSRFIWTPQQQEEFDLMFTSRISLQGRLNDQPRRADLLAENMVNFGRIVVERAEGGMACLRLTLF